MTWSPLTLQIPLKMKMRASLMIAMSMKRSTPMIALSLILEDLWQRSSTHLKLQGPSCDSTCWGFLFLQFLVYSPKPYQPALAGINFLVHTQCFKGMISTDATSPWQKCRNGTWKAGGQKCFAKQARALGTPFPTEGYCIYRALWFYLIFPNPYRHGCLLWAHARSAFAKWLQWCWRRCLRSQGAYAR